MANANAPRGLVPARHRNGAPYNGSVTRYYVPSSETNALYVGDPVIRNGSGDAAGVPGCILATAGATNYITGAVVGFETLTFANLSYNYRPGSTAGYVLVADDPDLMFEIQEDSVGGALAVTDISENADLVSGAGTAYGSGWQLDSSTHGTGATKQLRIEQIEQRPDNAVGANAKILVSINLHTERNTTGI